MAFFTGLISNVAKRITPFGRADSPRITPVSTGVTAGIQAGQAPRPKPVQSGVLDISFGGPSTASIGTRQGDVQAPLAPAKVESPIISAAKALRGTGQTVSNVLFGAGQAFGEEADFFEKGQRLGDVTASGELAGAVFGAGQATQEIVTTPELRREFAESFQSGELATVGALERAGSIVFDKIGFDGWAESLARASERDFELSRYLAPEVTITDKQTLSEKWSDPTFLSTNFAQNLPQLAGSIGLGGIGFAVGGPAGGFAGAGLFGAGSEGGFAYQDAIESGATPEQAEKTALLTMVVNGSLEALPTTRLLNKFQGPMNPLKRKFIKTVSQEILKQGLAEGSTESLQEIAGNTIAKLVFDENRDIFEGAVEAGIFGFVTGGLAAGGGGVVSGFRGAQALPGAEAGFVQIRPKTSVKTKSITEARRQERILARESLKGQKAQLQDKARIRQEKLTRGFQLERLKQRILGRDVDRVKGEITQSVVDNLPQSQRGKFINMVRRAKTQRDLIKAVTRVEKVADQYQRRLAINNIKNVSEKLIKSPSVDVGYKKQIRNILDGISLIKRRQSTIDRIKNTKRFIERQAELGRDVFIPREVINEVESLSRVPVQDIKTADLKNLEEKISALGELGRTKERTRRNLYEIEKQKRLDAIKRDATPIHTKELLRKDVGGRLTFGERFTNAYRSLYNFAQEKDLAITPMDPLIDMFDGSKGTYDGTVYRIFKQSVDRDFQSYLNNNDTVAASFKRKSEELGMNEANFERIGVHAARVQEGGRQKLLDSGLTEQEIDKVVLTDNEMAMYSYMRSVLDAQVPQITRTLRDIYNEELGDVNNYFTFTTDFDAMADAPIQDRVGGFADQIADRPTKTVEKGFTKERKGGEQPIKLHAGEVFLQHMENVAYFNAMSRNVKMLGEIVNSQDFADATGDRGQEIMRDWVDTVARKGGEQGQRMVWLDILRRNAGLAKLGFKATSFMIQPTAAFDAATLLGGRDVAAGTVGIASKDVRKFIMENMPEVRNRIGDDRAFIDFTKYNNTLRGKVGKIAYTPIKAMDGITASAAAWAGYIQKMRELGLEVDLSKPNQEALEYAQRMMNRTQASATFKDLPQAIQKGKLIKDKKVAGKTVGGISVSRALLQFQTFVLNRWSFIRRDALSAAIRGDYSKAAGIFTYLAMATMAEELLRRTAKRIVQELIQLLGFGADEDDPFFEDFTSDVGRNALTTIPFVSWGVSAAAYGSGPAPSLEAVSDLTKLVYDVFGRGKRGKQEFLNFLDSSGTIVGAPGTNQAVQILRDVLTTEAERLKRKESKERRTENEQARKDLDKIRKLREEGKEDEADVFAESLTEKEWEAVKRVSTSEKRKKTIELNDRMRPVLAEIRRLNKEGKGAEADAIAANLTDEEWEAIVRLSQK